MILSFHFQNFPFTSANALLTRPAAGSKTVCAPKQIKRNHFPPTVLSADFREILDQIVVCHLFALSFIHFYYMRTGSKPMNAFTTVSIQLKRGNIISIIKFGLAK